MNQLEVSKVSKSFGDKNVLKDIGFSCNTGEIVGLFGRNGSGKSTLLKLLFGTLKADAITIKFNNKVLAPKAVITSGKIGYLPQDSFIPKELKVRSVIPMFYHNSNDQDLIFHAPYVHRFDSKRVGELSLGQRRYLELLLVGNLEHPFLLLDEPFSMIEPLYKEAIKALLKKLTFYKGIILTDHYYQDVLDISSRNYLLKDSKLMPVSKKEDLKALDYLGVNH
jgi:ABC-type multidrug transport system ATPase subunit